MQDGRKNPAMEYEGDWLPEAYLREENYLPHRLKVDLATLFHHAVAPEELKEVPDESDWLEDRGARERQAEDQKMVAQIRNHNHVDMLRCREGPRGNEII